MNAKRFTAALTIVFVALAAAGCGSASQPLKSIGTSDESGSQFTSTPRPLVDRRVVPAQYQLQPFEQWTEQHAAADALGRIGPPAVPQLIQALRSPDPAVRLAATQVLARMGSDAKDAVPDLVRLLDDPDERIRKAATRTLGRIGPEAGDAVPGLMRSLLEPAASPPP